MFANLVWDLAGMKGVLQVGDMQVVPMEDINLHFTGDMHAIGVAHNLLSAMVDNHITGVTKKKLMFASSMAESCRYE